MAMVMAATVCVPRYGRSHVSTTSPQYSSPVARVNASRTMVHGPRLTLNLEKGIMQKFVIAKGKSGAKTPVRATLTAEEAPAKADLSVLKADLLTAVAGLDRGLVATKADKEIANSLAVSLEAAGDTFELPDDLDKLQGRWRLVFSSGFNTGSLGGQRPGPRLTRLPFSIGLVYQRIDVVNRELDNIVDLSLPTPWPVPPLEFTATLAHSFELVGGSKIKIVFEKTIVKPSGGLSSLPPIEIPQFQLPDFISPPRDIRSGEFETTFVDKDLWISRGDRGELRIFVRS